jgi:hypothetical protein
VRAAIIAAILLTGATAHADAVDALCGFALFLVPYALVFGIVYVALHVAAARRPTIARGAVLVGVGLGGAAFWRAAGGHGVCRDDPTFAMTAWSAILAGHGLVTLFIGRSVARSDGPVARARAHLAAGRPDEARSLVFGLDGDEAEALYEQASRALGVESPPRRTPAPFVRRYRCWELEVATADPALLRPFFKLLVAELDTAGVNLDRPDVDIAVFHEALRRAQEALRARAEPAAAAGGLARLTRIGAAG